MKKLLLIGLALAFCMVPAIPAWAPVPVDLVVNGDFEQPVVDTVNGCGSGGTGWDYCFSNLVNGWTVEWVTAGGLGNLEFQNADVGLGGPYEGSQYVEMDTHGSPTFPDANVSIYQDLDTCPPGGYRLSYAWRPRPNVVQTSMKLEVYWDGGLIATHSTQNQGWTSEIFDVGASSDTTRLEFVEVGTGDQLGTFLDAVSVVQTAPCYIEVHLDIKPGSYPNCFNPDGHGVIPVAILGAADFDVTQIDVSTLDFGGLEVRVKGNDNPQCSVEDVSGDFIGSLEGAPDGYPDLVCHFVDDPSLWTTGDGEATLTGNLLDDTPIEGTDSICIVPPAN